MSEETITKIQLILTEPEAPPPFIKFKAYRFGTKLELLELAEKIRSGEAGELEETIFVAGMVVDWNFKDEDTGEAIPIGDYKTLSIVQHAQVMAAWRAYAEQLWDRVDEVKKTNESP